MDENFCRRFPMVKTSNFQKPFSPFGCWVLGEQKKPWYKKFLKFWKKKKYHYIHVSNGFTVLLGPLNDLRESAIQFVKPRPLRNNVNPGGRWNSNTTWDAREAMVPGSVYDRQNRVRTHDPMTRISAHMGNVPGMSVPMSMVMNNQFNKKPPQSKSTHR